MAHYIDGFVLGANAAGIDTNKAGIAMAMAMANAPIIYGGETGFSISAGFGHFDGSSAGSARISFSPPENNFAITGSIASDFKDRVAFGAGAGFAF